MRHTLAVMPTISPKIVPFAISFFVKTPKVRWFGLFHHGTVAGCISFDSPFSSSGSRSSAEFWEFSSPLKPFFKFKSPLSTSHCRSAPAATNDSPHFNSVFSSGASVVVAQTKQQ